MIPAVGELASAAVKVLHISQTTYWTFGLYLVVMIAIGIYFYYRSNNLEDYLLGGRGLGSWVTALSAQASDMSGWLLMGLPGAVYLFGINQMWIAVGLLAGTFLNWVLVAPRLRLFTEKLNSLTIPSFLESRFRGPGNLIRVVTALLTLFFFTIYAAAGLVGAGKLFESMFGIDYLVAVLVGAGVMIFYTFLGGFLAVCWTDLLQGLLMFLAIIILPVYAYTQLEPGSVIKAYELRSVTMNLLPQAESTVAALLAVLSLLAWGLGYFGQPHILVRFMSIRSVKLFPRATTIAIVWVVISLAGAVMIGLLSVPMYDNLNRVTCENVFIYMIGDLFHPLLGGILLAAIMAAIMSTIDSQLLVSSSSLTEDFYVALFRRNSSEKEQLFVSRFSVVVITVISCLLALDRTSSIFDLVTFAWGGFGATFGPAILFGLYVRRTGWLPIFCGMLAGTAALLVWKLCGFNQYLYEIVPGALLNALVVWILNFFFPQRQETVLTQFDAVVAQLHEK